MKKILILGAGGFAQELYSWCRDTGFEVVGFFDEKKSGQLMGLPIYQAIPAIADCFALGVGDPRAKDKLWALGQEHKLRGINAIVHPSCILGETNILHEGVVLCPGVILTSGVEIHRGAMLNLNVTVGHNVKIGEFVTVSPGANISGEVAIGARAYIGTNACIREGIKIGKGAVIGMGAVVIKDVPDHVVMVGNPAIQKTFPMHA